MPRFHFTLKRFIFIGILFVMSVGSLLHFTYDWSVHNTLVSFFTPITESVWEHFKLGFYTLLLYSLIAYPFIKSQVNNYLFGMALLLLHRMLL